MFIVRRIITAADRDRKRFSSARRFVCRECANVIPAFFFSALFVIILFSRYFGPLLEKIFGERDQKARFMMGKTTNVSRNVKKCCEWNERESEKGKRDVVALIATTTQRTPKCAAIFSPLSLSLRCWSAPVDGVMETAKKMVKCPQIKSTVIKRIRFPRVCMRSIPCLFAMQICHCRLRLWFASVICSPGAAVHSIAALLGRMTSGCRKALEDRND